MLQCGQAAVGRPSRKGAGRLAGRGRCSPHAKYLRARWKSEEEINAKNKCPGSDHWHGRLSALNPIRDPGWTCVEYVRTGRSKKDIVMRVMFDTIREETIILHSVAVKLGLRVSGGPAWLTHQSEDPRYSSCKYVVPVLDWKGHGEWIRARGVSYTTPSERRDAPEGAREAFPEIAWEDLKISQEEGPVNMIIGRDNPEWMPTPMQEEPYERFTLMWTSRSPHYILRENEWTYGMA
jgi:hypothetical protein